MTTVDANYLIRSNIFSEIQTERAYQEKKWGVEFDDKNTINDWNTYVGIYMARATAMGASPEQQREGLKKVATILVAALETMERNGGKFPPRHYDGEFNAYIMRLAAARPESIGVLGV